MTWDEFKAAVDAKLRDCQRDGKVTLGSVRFPSGPSALNRNSFSAEIANRDRGPEEQLIIY